MEAEIKAERALEEKMRKAQQQKQLIEQSRKQQMDRINAEKEAKTKEEKEFAEFWKIRNKELSLAEQQEKQDAYNRQVELKKYQRVQSAKVQ